MKRLASAGAPPAWGVCLLLALAMGAVYIARAVLTCRWGFPLDDAWIHQTYARNLALLGEWSYVPGETSGGSTAPLWTLLLAVGHLARLSPVVWAAALGCLLLATIGWASARWIRARGASVNWIIWAAAISIVFEWHLGWAALSGMETLAVALAAIIVLWWIDARRTRDGALGMVIGASVWLRPDAISLALPAVLAIVVDVRGSGAQLGRRLGGLLAGIAVMFAPYLAFNRLTSGAWWPSTFYAKQAEYAVEAQASMASRGLEQVLVPLTGIGVLLAPGIALGLWDAWQKRSVRRILPLLWVAAYLGAFALRLPVVYQHGRYAMPVIPVVLVAGWEGIGRWAAPGALGAVRRVLSRAWVASALIVLAAFAVIGSGAFARDVAIIETEMVDTALWIRDHTPEGARIAAHDIGALGYFGERPLLDLAGLVSPDVIPILRDEEALAEFLRRERADYLMTFPGWYPRLTQQAEAVYASTARFSPLAGGENMTVYRWPGTAVSPSPTAMLYSPHSGGGR